MSSEIWIFVYARMKGETEPMEMDGTLIHGVYLCLLGTNLTCDDLGGIVAVLTYWYAT
jgi:hypothetical protein